MKRKLLEVGGALAVTLPEEVVRDFGLAKGDEVEVSVHPSTGAVTIRPGARYLEDGEVTENFERAVEDLLDRRADLYRRFAE